MRKLFTAMSCAFLMGAALTANAQVYVNEVTPATSTDFASQGQYAFWIPNFNLYFSGSISSTDAVATLQYGADASKMTKTGTINVSNGTSAQISFGGDQATADFLDAGKAAGESTFQLVVTGLTGDGEMIAGSNAPGVTVDAGVITATYSFGNTSSGGDTSDDWETATWGTPFTASSSSPRWIIPADNEFEGAYVVTNSQTDLVWEAINFLYTEKAMEPNQVVAPDEVVKTDAGCVYIFNRIIGEYDYYFYYNQSEEISFTFFRGEYESGDDTPDVQESKIGWDDPFTTSATASKWYLETGDYEGPITITTNSQTNLVSGDDTFLYRDLAGMQIGIGATSGLVATLETAGYVYTVDVVSNSTYFVDNSTGVTFTFSQAGEVEAKELVEGDNWISNNAVYYYTPDSNGTLTLAIQPSGDAVLTADGYLYSDEDHTTLVTPNRATPDDGNYQYAYTLEAGSTYYVYNNTGANIYVNAEFVANAPELTLVGGAKIDAPDANGVKGATITWYGNNSDDEATPISIAINPDFSGDAGVTITPEDVNVVVSIESAEVNSEGTGLDIVFSTTLPVGTYTVSVAEGFVLVGNDAMNMAQDLELTVASEPGDQEISQASAGIRGLDQNGVKQAEIYWTDPKDEDISISLIPNSGVEITVVNSETDEAVEDFTVAVNDDNTALILTFAEALAAGDYAVTVPEGLVLINGLENGTEILTLTVATEGGDVPVGGYNAMINALGFDGVTEADITWVMVVSEEEEYVATLERNDECTDEVTVEPQDTNAIVPDFTVSVENDMIMISFAEALALGKYTVIVPEGYVLVNDEPCTQEVLTLEVGVTGIDSIFSNDGDVKVYNLNGVRVNKENLTNGLYIINGKKVMIRK